MSRVLKNDVIEEPLEANTVETGRNDSVGVKIVYRNRLSEQRSSGHHLLATHQKELIRETSAIDSFAVEILLNHERWEGDVAMYNLISSCSCHLQQ